MVPLIGESPERNTANNNPNNIKEKYSGAPKRRANAASGGARKVSPMTPTVPAINEPMAAMPRAAPALPFCDISYPSIQVTTDAASPGMRIKIEVVDPPYIAP